MIGRTLAHYEILEEISRGGMGIVYRAHDVKLDRDVALKILPPELVEDEGRKRRFVQEARAAAALHHPNIATVFDIGEADGTTFIAMELVEGEQLSDLLSRGPLSFERSLQLAREIADGLARAHEKGIVHRDLKPSNIMIGADGHAKLIDFGLAKLIEMLDQETDDVSEAATAIKETRPGAVVGTVSYMSPEQAKGTSIDHRSDIFSFGIVLHEMLSGRAPFDRNTAAETIAAILKESPPTLSVDAHKIQGIVDRCLAKDPESRYQTIEDVADALRRESEPTRSSPLVKKSLVAASLVAMAAGWLFYQNHANVRWAREVAVPEVARLMEQDDYVSAFDLAREAERYIPDDPTLADLWQRLTRPVTFDTEPSGADVYYRAYGRPEAGWEHLGLTPVDARRVPYSPFWLRIEKDGYHSRETLVPPHAVSFVLGPKVELDAVGSVPEGMVPIRAGKLSLPFAGFDPSAYDSPSFHIDAHEVTNEAFQRFVDEDGYRNEAYWKHPFEKDGAAVSWDDAMAEFRDETGRAGPSTWAGGTFPEGQSNYPVSGVSWYEAAAYAEFVGKRLPTVYHWLFAAGVGGAEVVLPLANFDGDDVRPVASEPPAFFGMYDMAGNVKEWCWNASGSERYILGGSWAEPEHMFYEPDFRDPFDRSPTNGFRLALYDVELTGDSRVMLDPIERPLGSREDEAPVSDDTFEAYKAQFFYDPMPLNASVESVNDDSQHSRQETISLDAAYGEERLLVHVFLPKNVDPPYQGVLFWPGSGANTARSSDALLNMNIVDFLIMSGRAVIYPVFKGTYERNDGVLTYTDAAATRQYTDYVVWWMKDLMRSMDYVETRDDFDAGKIGYVGFSWGGRLGNIALAVDDRLKLGIILSGGLNAQAPRPEVSETHYASRVRAPVLMLGGSRDVVFPLETSQKLMFSLLGTPDEDKKHVVFDAGHALFVKNQGRVFSEMLDWLDRYLGPVE